MTVEKFITTHMFTYNENSKNLDKYVGINQGALEESLRSFTRLKCQELLEIVAEKADNMYMSSEFYGKDSILNAVDLNEFIK